MFGSILELEDVRNLVHVFSVEEYHKLLDAGLVPVKTELIEGVIVRKITKGDDHVYFCNLLYDALRAILPSGFFVSKEDPISLSNSEPEPDISIIQGSHKDYRNKKPVTAFLIVEVAKSSLGYDRRKIPLYAAAEVEHYWIVDIDNKRIETYTRPQGNDYLSMELKTAKDVIHLFDKEISLSVLFE
jgi:Uma2 family endonuclease